MSANPQPSPLLYLAGITIVTVVGWLAITLWSGQPDDRSYPLNSETQNNIQTYSSESDYDFYSVLAAAEVVVPISNYISTPKTAKLEKPTLIQIAAFRDRDQADQIRVRLRKVGLNSAQVVERQTSTGLWYLVRTSPFKTYAELKQAINLAERLNFHPRSIQLKKE